MMVHRGGGWPREERRSKNREGSCTTCSSGTSDDLGEEGGEDLEVGDWTIDPRS